MNKSTNFVGFYTLIEKETARFMSVYLQTIIAPIVTTLMFYAVFETVFAGRGREVFGYEFMIFLAPGLVMMSMAQNAFANASTSLIIGKMQNSINDILMAPLSSLALLGGYTIGGLWRGLIIGFFSVLLLLIFLNIPFTHIGWIIVFSVLGCSLLSLLGLLGGLWADKFDHLAVISNFVITPLTYLSGTFYSIGMLPEMWKNLAFFNPFFYMIDGFRYGFLGVGDADPVTGAVILMVVNILLGLWCYFILESGYKIKS